MRETARIMRGNLMILEYECTLYGELILTALRIANQLTKEWLLLYILQGLNCGRFVE